MPTSSYDSIAQAPPDNSHLTTSSRAIDTPSTNNIDGFIESIDAEEEKAVEESNHATEIANCAVGPMPAELFLNGFLPYNHDIRSFPAQECEEEIKRSQSIPSHDKDECYTLRDLCVALNRDCSGFRFVCTNSCTDTCTPGPDRKQPSICFYRDDVVDLFKREGENYVSNPGFAELFVEENEDISSDPFKDIVEDDKGKEKGFIRTDKNEERQKEINVLLARYLSYAMALFSRQYRTHCFFIAIFGCTARLFRFDRAGVIISEAFKFRETPWLGEFTRRYCQATDAQRGYDATVTKASLHEEKIFAETVRDHAKTQLGPLNENLDGFIKMHYAPNRVFKIAIRPQTPQNLFSAIQNSTTQAPDADFDKIDKKALAMLGIEISVGEGTNCITSAVEALSDPGLELEQKSTSTAKRTSICRKYTDTQYVLVSRPLYIPASLTGRISQGYWAVKLPDENREEKDYQICFLKDTWRKMLKSKEREGDIMVELIESGVNYVSDILCHSDVHGVDIVDDDTRGHVTRTQVYEDAEWNLVRKRTNLFLPYQHYRVVFEQVGVPLRQFLGPSELLSATFNTFIASLQALVNCRRLHRDVSLNNIIIIRKNGEFVAGLLIDWELSTRCDNNGRAYCGNQTGTWPFISIKKLRNYRNHKHTFRDDMESFYYVILFAAVRWVSHNEVPDLERQISHFFYEYIEGRGGPRGGSAKLANLCKKGFNGLFTWDDAATEQWLKDALRLQKLELIGQNTWTPKGLMEAWVRAFKLRRSVPNKNINDLQSTAADLSILVEQPNIRSPPEAFSNLKRKFEEPVNEESETRGSEKLRIKKA